MEMPFANGIDRGCHPGRHVVETKALRGNA